MVQAKVPRWSFRRVFSLALVIAGIFIFISGVILSIFVYEKSLHEREYQDYSQTLNREIRSYEKILYNGSYDVSHIEGKLSAQKLDCLTTLQLKNDLHISMKFYVCIYDREKGNRWEFGDKSSHGKGYSSTSTVNIMYRENQVNIGFLETTAWE